MPRRTHSKVSELPEALRKAVEKLLLDGRSYDEITEFLTANGTKIGRSSVGRFGKDFSKSMERLTLASRQAEAIVKEIGDRPATELNEAAEKLATQMIFERLLELGSDIEEAKFKDLMYGIAALQDSAVRRERAKLAFSKESESRAAKAAAEIGKIAKAGGLDEAKIREIQAKVFNIAKPAGGK